LAIGAVLTGCIAPDRPSALGPAAGWKKYTSREGRFLVVAPPLKSESEDYWTLDSRQTTSVSWTFDQGRAAWFRVTYFRLESPLDKKGQERFLKAFKISAPQQKVWLLNSREIEVDDGSGREFDLYFGAGPGRARGKGRFLFFGADGYFIQGGFPGLQGDDGRIRLFFDTFMHLGDPGVNLRKGDAA
jgi:hypothetical protein